MGLLLLLVPCLIAGVRALGIAGIPITSSVLPPLPISNPPPSSPSPPPIPLLYFDDIPQLTTCESATFNWTYTDSVTLQLIISIVTDRNVSSNTSSPSGVATPNFNRVISSTVNPSLNTYTWPAVDVPQGWYKLYATIPARSFNTTSTDFFVKTGSDVSCLLSSSTASRSSTNMAAIVGGALGGTALLLSTAIIFLLYRRHRLDRTESRTAIDNGKRGRSGKGGKPPFFSAARPKSWDNLGSVDSHAGAAARDSYCSKRLHYQNRHPISQASIADSVNLPVLEYGRNPSQRRSSEAQGYSSPGDSALYKYPLSDGAPSSRSRKPSDTSSLAASTALSHVMGPSAILEVGPPSYRSPSPTQTVPSSLEAGNPLELALTSTKPHKSRKATRKPVPTYDPSTDPRSSPPPASPTLEDVTTTLSPLHIADDPFARPLPAALIHRDSTASLDLLGGFSSAPSSGHGHGHYISRTQSINSGVDRGLTHKQSFGGFEGRPMHYLIPDMPLPQK